MPARPKPHWIVITTIHAPNENTERLARDLGDDWGIVVVGDAQTPPLWTDAPVEFLSLDRQRELFGAFAAEAPTNHYSRKNFGYLYARQRGAVVILETDDDNLPYPSFADAPARTLRGRLVGGGDWVNVYRWFTERLIWPRGLPLDAIHQPGELLSQDASRECPVQQFLVDDDPDVDAIFRQVFPQTGFAFDPAAPAVLLEPGTWCPFNTQNTLWFEEAFPLLYLPHFANFRVSDIWRSLVAQRALWLAQTSLGFRTSTVSQRRNPHDLQRDFLDEIPSYTKNRAVAACLDHASRELAGLSHAEASRRLWLALLAAGFLPKDEAPLIQRWYDALNDGDQRS